MNEEEIIELVKYGCDPELIAFEFDVPINEIKEKINAEAQNIFSDSVYVNNKIRLKYFNEYYSYNCNDGDVDSLEPTPNEEEIVQKTIDYIKREQENIEDMSEYNKNALLRSMLVELKILDTTKSTLEQTKKRR